MAMSSIITHLLATMIGVALGLPLGAFLRGVVKDDVRGQTVDEPSSTDQSQQRYRWPRARWLRSRVWQSIIGFGLIVLTIVTFTTVAIAIQRYEDVTVCQADENAVFKDTYIKREDADSTDRKSQRDLVDAMVKLVNVILLDEAATLDVRRVAMAQWRMFESLYRERINETDEIRSASPLPNGGRCEP